MKPLEDLGHQLSVTIRTIGVEVGVAHSDAMAKTLAELRRKYSERDRRQIPRNRILEALNDLHSRGAALACERDMLSICWGMGNAFDNHPALISRGDGVVREILDFFLHEFERKKPSRSAWLGLLNTYINAPVRPDVGPQLINWIEVRDFLARTWKRLLATQKNVPIWLQTLSECPEFLSDDPCGRFGAALWEGDDESVKIFCEALSISQDSWFRKELILSPVRYLCSQNDAVYLSGLRRITHLLTDHPFLVDRALQILLARHYESLADAPQNELLDFAVRRWRNPIIFPDDQWRLVEPAIRKMVCGWIIEDDLKDFFELLQADGVAADDRMNFWRGYVKQIDFARFVLGEDTKFKRGAGYTRLKTEKRDRVAYLDDGAKSNNAFIIRIGQYYFVEFGEKPNACYIYSENNVPFSRKSGHYIIKNLKNADADAFLGRIVHNGRWAEHAKDRLRDEFNIQPDRKTQFNKALHKEKPFYSSSLASTFHTGAASAPLSARSAHNWVTQATDIAQKHNLKIDDRRSKQGPFWVQAESRLHPAGETLTGLGFKFIEGHGFWRT